jgi:hypothetical protein
MLQSLFPLATDASGWSWHDQDTSLRGVSSQPAKNFAEYHLGMTKIKGYAPFVQLLLG